MKLWPSLVPYEYGFRVILFTFCLIIVSGYRMGNPITTAMDRLYSIAIGGFVAVSVNVLIFPIWAGEQLHRELVNNFDSVADSLEGLNCYFTHSFILNRTVPLLRDTHSGYLWTPVTNQTPCTLLNSYKHNRLEILTKGCLPRH